MTRPNVDLHDPHPEYLRRLIGLAEMTQAQVAQAIGISPRQLRAYLSTKAGEHQDAPYLVQYALEGLAGADWKTREAERDRAARLTLAMLLKSNGGKLTIRHDEVINVSPRSSIERYDDDARRTTTFLLHEPA